MTLVKLAADLTIGGGEREARPRNLRGGARQIWHAHTLYVRECGNHDHNDAPHGTEQHPFGILGLWVGDGGEGAKFWLAVLTEIYNRRTADVCIVVCDGLRGPAEAVNTVWDRAVI